MDESKKNERIRDLIKCAFLSKELDSMTDKEMADIFSEHIMPDMPIASEGYCILSCIESRLRRANGGPLPAEEE